MTDSKAALAYPWFFTHRSPGCLFFRLFGWGLWIGSYRLHRPLFSERYGYTRVLRVGGWRVKVLRP